MNEYQHWFGCTRFWLSFNPDIGTQAILGLYVAALSCESQKDTVELSCFVGKRNGATDIARAAPSKCQSLSFNFNVRRHTGPANQLVFTF
jgi:hypothetical protein